MTAPDDTPDTDPPPERGPAVVATPYGRANPLWAWTVLVAAGIIWGLTFSLARIASTGGAHPLGVTLWQGLIGGLALLAFDRARRRRLPLDRRHLEFYVVCGFLGTALPSPLLFYSAEHLSAGVLSITLATVPIVTFVLAVPLGIDRVTVLRIVGLVLGLSSIVMLAAPESSLPDPGAVPWVFASVAAATCYAAENTFIAVRRPPGSDAFTVLAGMLTAAALMMLPLVLATGTFVPLAWPPGPIELAVVGMAVINVLGYGTFVALVTYAGPVFASQMAYVVTLSGVGWGILLFGEVHSAWVWAALVTMIGGLVLIKPHGKDPK